MYNGLAFFKTASALAQHASLRQASVAQNIANADTPGYQARDLPEFTEAMVGPRREVALRATRPDHIASGHGGPAAAAVAREVSGDASPNGNTVSLETEMVKGSMVKQQHELAVATYRSGMDLLRTALGRGR